MVVTGLSVRVQPLPIPSQLAANPGNARQGSMNRGPRIVQPFFEPMVYVGRASVDLDLLVAYRRNPALQFSEDPGRPCSPGLMPEIRQREIVGINAPVRIQQPM